MRILDTLLFCFLFALSTAYRINARNPVQDESIARSGDSLYLRDLEFENDAFLERRDGEPWSGKNKAQRETAWETYINENKKDPEIPGNWYEDFNCTTPNHTTMRTRVRREEHPRRKLGLCKPCFIEVADKYGRCRTCGKDSVVETDRYGSLHRRNCGTCLNRSGSAQPAAHAPAAQGQAPAAQGQAAAAQRQAQPGNPLLLPPPQRQSVQRQPGQLVEYSDLAGQRHPMEPATGPSPVTAHGIWGSKLGKSGESSRGPNAPQRRSLNRRSIDQDIENDAILERRAGELWRGKTDEIRNKDWEKYITDNEKTKSVELETMNQSDGYQYRCSTEVHDNKGPEKAGNPVFARIHRDLAKHPRAQLRLCKPCFIDVAKKYGRCQKCGKDSVEKDKDYFEKCLGCKWNMGPVHQIPQHSAQVPGSAPAQAAPAQAAPAQAAPAQAAPAKAAKAFNAGGGPSILNRRSVDQYIESNAILERRAAALRKRASIEEQQYESSDLHPRNLVHRSIDQYIETRDTDEPNFGGRVPWKSCTECKKQFHGSGESCDPCQWKLKNLCRRCGRDDPGGRYNLCISCRRDDDRSSDRMRTATGRMEAEEELEKLKVVLKDRVDKEKAELQKNLKWIEEKLPLTLVHREHAKCRIEKCTQSYAPNSAEVVPKMQHRLCRMHWLEKANAWNLCEICGQPALRIESGKIIPAKKCAECNAKDVKRRGRGRRNESVLPESVAPAAAAEQHQAQPAAAAVPQAVHRQYGPLQAVHPPVNASPSSGSPQQDEGGIKLKPMQQAERSLFHTGRPEPLEPAVSRSSPPVPNLPAWNP